MIGDSLMNRANEVRTGRSRELEAELSGGVGLGAASHDHAIGQVDEDDFVSGGGLAGGGVGDGAGEGLGGGLGR